MTRALWRQASRRVRWMFSLTAGCGLAAGITGYVTSRVTPEMVAAGGELFVHEWQPHDPLAGGGDGLGPVFNANSCAACHFLGGVGGAGSNQRNVTAFEVLPTRRDHRLHAGVVHASATSDDLRETRENVNQLYPIVPGGRVLIGSCFREVSDFDPVQYLTLNTPALFGAGLIDGISSGSIRRNVGWNRLSSVSAELSGDFTSTSAGRVRILEDGRVGRFGWKAQFATLDEFVATACAVEVGLTNPNRSQDEPRQHVPDDDAGRDMTRQQFQELVAFCSQLQRPVKTMPLAQAARQQVLFGESQFMEIGCTDCHTRDLDNVEGIYSDLALHTVENPALGGSYFREELEVPIPSSHPDADEWKTPPLWGIADSAPYWHDGSSPTLKAAILRHHGQAKHVAARYEALDDNGRDAILAFLGTLRAPVTVSQRK